MTTYYDGGLCSRGHDMNITGCYHSVRNGSVSRHCVECRRERNKARRTDYAAYAELMAERRRRAEARAAMRASRPKPLPQFDITTARLHIYDKIERAMPWEREALQRQLQHLQVEEQ